MFGRSTIDATTLGLNCCFSEVFSVEDGNPAELIHGLAETLTQEFTESVTWKLIAFPKQSYASSKRDCLSESE